MLRFFAICAPPIGGFHKPRPDTNLPLSDSKISAILGQKGIKIARRTVTKYREALMIPATHERKLLPELT